MGEQPGLGRAVPGVRAGLRVLQAGKYLIYYGQRSSGVMVADVVSGERDQLRAVLGGEG